MHIMVSCCNGSKHSYSKISCSNFHKNGCFFLIPQMVYIHTWKTQRRVVARKRDHGTFISIPMDYPLNFKVLPGTSSNKTKLCMQFK